MIRKIIYNKLLYRFASYIYRKIGSKFLYLQFDISADLPNTKAISPNVVHPTFIYINDGRFQNSTVKSGGEKAKLINQIIGGLKNFHGRNGKPILKDARATKEIYRGNIPKKFPDIMLEQDDYLVYNDLFQPQILQEKSQNCHCPNGILICYGNKIKKTDLKNPRIIDLAPTILHILGIPAPKNIDGKVLDITK